MFIPPSSANSRNSAANALDVDHLVDTKTAAKVLGLRNHHTLEVWRSTQRCRGLRFFRVGRAIRYSLSDLAHFLHANTVGGTPNSPQVEQAVGQAHCASIVDGARPVGGRHD